MCTSPGEMGIACEIWFPLSTMCFRHWTLVCWDRFFLCSPGCPGTPCIDQAGPNSQRYACLCLLSAGVKVCNHAWPSGIELLDLVASILTCKAISLAPVVRLKKVSNHRNSDYPPWTFTVCKNGRQIFMQGLEAWWHSLCQKGDLYCNKLLPSLVLRSWLRDLNSKWYRLYTQGLHVVELQDVVNF